MSISKANRKLYKEAVSTACRSVEMASKCNGTAALIKVAHLEALVDYIWELENRDIDFRCALQDIAELTKVLK
jgi:hypothetical protein